MTAARVDAAHACASLRGGRTFDAVPASALATHSGTLARGNTNDAIPVT
jgi:hypothetical protein